MIHVDDDEIETELKQIRNSVQEYRQKKISALLRGPYICPKCRKDHFFGKKTTTKTEKDILNTYVFECRYKGCGFKVIDKKMGNDTIIDAYNRVIDNES